MWLQLYLNNRNQGPPNGKMSVIVHNVTGKLSSNQTGIFSGPSTLYYPNGALVQVTGSSFHPKIISSIMSDIISKRQSFVLSRVILIHSRAIDTEMIILSKEEGIT